MLIIPAINCDSFQCVKERLEIAGEFLSKLPKSKRWVQIDISDGKFTKAKTWNDPKQLEQLQTTNHRLRTFKIEAHLMVEDWVKEIKKWEGVAERIIVHAEALAMANCHAIIKSRKAEIGLALNPNTPAGAIFPHLNKIKLVQLLAVKTGYSGQKFDKNIINKITFFKKHYPKIKIEVDGGINLKTGKLVKKSGADFAVCGSYIFDNKSPQKAYKNLMGA